MMRLLTTLAAVIDEDQLNIPKPSGGLTSERITDGLQIIFGIAAAAAVVIIAISALRIVISRGNSQDVQKARDSIVYASVGLAITLSALLIVTFVVERI